MRQSLDMTVDQAREILRARGILKDARVELEDLPQGWFHHGPKVLDLLQVHRPVVAVELGTWLGASAIAMVRMLQRWGGTLTCVDTWYGTVDGAPRGSSPLMILSAARNFVQAGVSAHIRLIAAPTVDAARAWNGPPVDFLYIDADHSEAGTRADLEAWVPLVRRGGLIAGDDYGNAAYPGVRLAWDAFARARGLALTRYQTEPANPYGVELIYGTV
jgi:predicted O-methyltransferase YrrM